jgi:hypothetical protein
MLIGLLIAIGIGIFVRRENVTISPQVIFGLAFAITPLILFNQQIVTGRSLQPVHYEIFIANYMALTAFVLLLSLIFEHARAKSESGKTALRPLLYLAIFAAGWGVVEATGSTKRNSPFADLRDLSVPAVRYISKQGTPPDTAVFAVNTGIADFIPTIANLRPLWSSHSSSAGGIDIAENKRLFYLFLYYAGFSEKEVADALHAKAFEVTAALFGSERALPDLANHSEAITEQEIETESELYGQFIRKFSKETASQPVLSYAIVPTAQEPHLANLDKWYQHDAGTVTGALKVYKLTLRP